MSKTNWIPLAVIVAEPAFLAVTLPLESTVATDVFELVQVTVLFNVLFGATVGFNVAVSLTYSVFSFCESVTLATAGKTEAVKW